MNVPSTEIVAIIKLNRFSGKPFPSNTTAASELQIQIRIHRVKGTRRSEMDHILKDSELYSEF